MKWFAGSIDDAVTTSKQRKAIFVVFVEGKDDISNQVAAIINESQISERLEHPHFVAIKLESDSESYRFFQQIYQVVPVPSLFFIGTNGVPMDVMLGSVTAAEMAKKIDSILEKVGGGAGCSSTDLIEAEKSVPVTTNVPTAANSSEEAGTSGSSPEMQAEGSIDAPKELSNEEKFERAKQLIELQRRQKIEKEREEEKIREIERRKLGKDVQAAKQRQHEAEIKLAHEERLREKAAEAAARERVRQQIAQDKMDRKQRELALQEQVAKQQQQNQQERADESSVCPAGDDGAVARIQFRLPAGNTHMGKFKATNTLGSLRSYVVSNIELPFQKFAMSTTFPRRDLTSEDDDKTLTELELVPTAVILILPLKNAKVTTAVTSGEDIGFFSRFAWVFFAPIFSVYNYIVGYFNGGLMSSPDARPGAALNVAAGGAQENVERFGRSATPPSGNLFGSPATTIRSRGNIHRLHTGTDDNDENNTWNGNSTQQM